MFSEDLGVSGDWNAKPEFLREKPTKVEKVIAPLTPQERLARAAQNLRVLDGLVIQHNAETGMNGDLGPLIEATREERLAKEALPEQKT